MFAQFARTHKVILKLMLKTINGEIMGKELIIKRCNRCGAVVEMLHDCDCNDCGIVCCGENMETLNPNSTDAAAEKHLPVYEIVGNYIIVSVPHVMESEHYIEFIGLYSAKINAKKYFTAGNSAKAVFPYIKGAKLFAYCNKHGLWETTIQ